MKNAVRKALCLAMILVLVLSINSSVSASAFNGRITNSVAINPAAANPVAENPIAIDSSATNSSITNYSPTTNSLDWGDYLYYDFVITTGPSGEIIWNCPDQDEYYLLHGRVLDFSYYLNHAEYEAFRASGVRLAEFMALRESGLWFCVILERWVCPEEYGIIFLWDMPYSDEPWLEDSELIELQREAIRGDIMQLDEFGIHEIWSGTI